MYPFVAVLAHGLVLRVTSGTLTITAQESLLFAHSGTLEPDGGGIEPCRNRCLGSLVKISGMNPANLFEGDAPAEQVTLSADTRDGAAVREAIVALFESDDSATFEIQTDDLRWVDPFA
jgi:hypothetical protein